MTPASNTPSEPLAYVQTADRIIDGCIIAVAEYTTDELREIARESDRRSNGESWLGRMLREYIETWRQ